MLKKIYRKSNFFLSKQMWRYIFFLRRNWFYKYSTIFVKRYFHHSDVFHNMFRFGVYGKSSFITRTFVDSSFEIYLGNRWGLLEASRWHVGYKFGEFFRTRKYEIYRDKASRKAEKKRRKSELSKKKKHRERSYKIEIIRQMKMFGMRKRLHLYRKEFKKFEIAPKRFKNSSRLINS